MCVKRNGTGNKSVLTTVILACTIDLTESEGAALVTGLTLQLLNLTVTLPQTPTLTVTVDEAGPRHNGPEPP